MPLDWVVKNALNSRSAFDAKPKKGQSHQCQCNAAEEKLRG
jgi:hypothetical protein